MISPAWVRVPVLLAIGLFTGACDSLEVEDNQFGVIFVPTVRLESGGYAATPSAIFFEASGVRLSSTQIGAEGCIVQDIPPTGSNAFDAIDAGDAIAVNLGGTDAVLEPYTVGAQVTYQLPEGESIPHTPGDQITFSIPGAAGGFPARVVMVQTVEAFTPGDVVLPASTTADLTVTWSPASTTPGTAMYYSFRYSDEATGALDREIACVFADDGSGVVTASMLQGFRESELHTIVAQRARIVADQIGEAVTHITTTMSLPVDLIEGP